MNNPLPGMNTIFSFFCKPGLLASISFFLLHPNVSAFSSTPIPLRINCGGGDTTDKERGVKWLGDKEFLLKGSKYKFPGAEKIKTKTPHADDPAPQSVYGSARRDGVAYHFTKIPDGRYTVRLHFVDTKPRNRRSMEFWIEGKKLVHGLNVTRAAGGAGKALVVELVVDVADGNGLEIRGSKGTGDDCYVCGIEILRAPADAVLSLPTGTDEVAPENLAAMIRDFAGGPLRMVWTRVTDEGDFYAKGEHGQLYVLDTEERAERCLLAESRSYAKPMISEDGWQVVFTDSVARACYAVGWQGGEPRKIADGYATDVWRDPRSGRDWVYVRTGWRDTAAPVIRVRLDDPAVHEPVWSATPVGQAMVCDLQLSDDGTLAVAGFPWPNCGIATLETGDFTPIGSGCWPSIGPGENPRFFHFLGVHTAIHFFDQQGAKPRQIKLATVPGWTGRKLYHPRWSNHPRLITATAPQWQPETELYLGRFDERYTQIEAWKRVTFNNTADFFGDAWSARGLRTQNRYPQKDTYSDKPAYSSPAAEGAMLFRWDLLGAKNAITDAAGKVVRVSTLTMKGRARSNASLGAEVRDGFLLADEASAKAVVEALGKAEPVTLAFTARAMDVDGVVVHVGGAGSKAALEIAQAGGDLVLTLRDAAGKARPPSTLGQITRHEWQRWMIQIAAGEVIVWRDGVRMGVPLKMLEAPSVLDAALVFGAHPSGERSWRGSLEALRILGQKTDDAAAGADYEIQRAAWEKRKTPARAKVEAELVQASEPTDVDRLAPYTRSLAENVYRVLRTIEGTAVEGDIVVLQWIIMDSQVLGESPEPGTRFTLEIESADEHPELAGEHRSSDIFEPALPVFYDTGS
jgi:hypothetical protein